MLQVLIILQQQPGDGGREHNLFEGIKQKFQPHSANPGPAIPQNFTAQQEGTKEERRAKVATTRAKEFLLIVADKRWINHPIYTKKWKATKFVEGIAVPKATTAIIELMETLVRQQCYTDMTLDKHASRACRPQTMMQVAMLDSLDAEGNCKEGEYTCVDAIGDEKARKLWISYGSYF